jgi:hypothetical protein
MRTGGQRKSHKWKVVFSTRDSRTSAVPMILTIQGVNNCQNAGGPTIETFLIWSCCLALLKHISNTATPGAQFSINRLCLMNWPSRRCWEIHWQSWAVISDRLCCHTQSQPSTILGLAEGSTRTKRRIYLYLLKPFCYSIGGLLNHRQRCTGTRPGGGLRLSSDMPSRQVSTVITTRNLLELTPTGVFSEEFGGLLL